MFQWTRWLRPISALYGAASAHARSRAARARRGIRGLHVVAVGGLTVGGSGKSTLARWLASEVVRAGGRPALLLRGHRARGGWDGTRVLPDFDGYSAERAAREGGDEAAAHRSALGKAATIAADPDRFRGAETTRQGYGASVVILDDGWEQGSLAWDELWVALDPVHPFGNGLLLPAGPLRRPIGTIAEAHVIALIQEDETEAPAPGLLDRIRELAPRARLLRFLRALEGISPLADGSTGITPSVSERRRVALVSGVGAPERLERFACAAGLRVVSHAAFPDHARWSGSDVRQACEEALRSGAEVILLTDKDEARWPRGLVVSLPVEVLRTSLRPLEDAAPALHALRSAAGRGTAGGVAAEGALG